LAGTASDAQVIRFATFEVDVRAGEIRKSGMKLKLGGQPFQVLAILLERPGEIVSREELQKRLWPDTFVDVDHSVNTAINKIREVLGDSAESPRYVETVPRRGYRFVAPLNSDGLEKDDEGEIRGANGGIGRWRWWFVGIALVLGLAVIPAVMRWRFAERGGNARHAQPILTRLTFDEGLQIGGTWSPDGRYIAYSSDRGGKFDIWVQQVGGGDPVQITKGPGQNWQPDWSPDGRYIAYRSEQGEGGIFMMPALGGAGHERRLSGFGYYPRWSPDGKRILLRSKPISCDGNR
jgi:DNA-binding winged helix-turn-helix (wHTH) protein/roadblock/LC7 domain-containing protein